MTLLKKYGVRGIIKKIRELSRFIPMGQLMCFALSELRGYLKGKIYRIYRWGYFGKYIYVGKKVYIHFKKTKYIGDHADLRDFCQIQGKGIVEIGCNSGIGEFGIIRSSNHVHIGNNVLIGPRVFITDSDHGFESRCTPIYLQDIKSDKVIIEDDVWIGANVIILKGISVGTGAIIGAGSVVTKNVPKYSVVAGNPAKIIRERKR